MRQFQNDVEGALEDYDKGRSLQDIDNLDHSEENAVAYTKSQMAIAYRKRAMSRLRQGDSTGADRDYEDAHHFAPDEYLLCLGRAGIRMVSGDVDGAVRYCKEAIRIDPEREEAQGMLNALREIKPTSPGRSRTSSHGMKTK